MKKFLITALVLVLAIALSVTAMADEPAAEFDPNIEVSVGDDTITVTVSAEGDNNTILNERQPKLSIPCEFTAAQVEFEGRVISSTLTGGKITFTVEKGGVYTITDTYVPDIPYVPTPVTPPVQEEPETPIEDMTHPFEDVPEDSWYENAVKFVYNEGLMDGMGDDSFAPATTLTRGMVMTMLARAAGVDTSVGDAWYSVGLEWAKENDISDGTDHGSSITREQIVTMLWRYAGCPVSTNSIDSFADSGDVSGYAIEAMRWAIEKGIIEGRDGNKIAPAGTANRAEAAAIFMRYFA